MPALTRYFKKTVPGLRAAIDFNCPVDTVGLSPPIQSLWVGKSITSLEALSINSFLRQGHEFHLYTYGDVSGVPPDAVIKDAESILPESMVFELQGFQSYAGFADYFRYALLYAKGGWWSDLDVVCVRPLSFLSEYVFASEFDLRAQRESPTNCVMKCPPASSIMKYAFEVCFRKQVANIKWGETGPQLIAKAIKKFDLQRAVMSAATFCPVPHFEWPELILPGRKLELPSDTYGVHLWNEMWRRNRAEKDEKYPDSSLYSLLKRQYGDL